MLSTHPRLQSYFCCCRLRKVSAEDYVSRDEHQAAIARLDAADAELRQSIVNTERVLRGEFMEAVTAAADGLKSEIVLRNQTLEGKVDVVDDKVESVDNHLSWQNRTIGAAILSGIVSFIVLAATHVIKFA